MQSITKEEILEIIKLKISQILFIDENDIEINSRFEEDLSADQILMQDFYESLEEHFMIRNLNVSFDDKDRKEVEKIGDLVELVSFQVNV
ncbi:MAG: hypothetical protein U0R17_02850 [Acidimicrobiia bacterium]